MQILCVTPESDKHRTPEMGFADTLRKAGHIVATITTGYDTNKIEIIREVLEVLSIHKPDVVWGMMEYALPTAAVYAKLLDVPLVAHIECIPPWRVGLNTAEEYGFDYNDGDFKEVKDIAYYTKLYNILLKYYDNADFRTISGDEWRYTYEDFTGSPLEAETRYYTWNEESLKKYKGNYEVKNQICAIARFTPMKRIHHVIRAISKIPKDIRPKFKLIGYGPEENYLFKLAKDLDVDMEMLGSGKNGIKEKVIQESMFMVQIFAGIPVIEGAYYGKVAVSYGMAHMKEVYGDMAVWVKTNDIDALSDKIKELILDKKKRGELGIKANKLLIEGGTNVHTNKEFVDIVIKQFEQAIIRHRLKTNYLFIKPLIKDDNDKIPLDYAHYRMINDKDFKGKVLDVGSGCCVFTMAAKKTKPDIDIIALERNITYANLGLVSSSKCGAKIKVINYDIDYRLFESDTFDTVVLSHVFEHCTNLNIIMKWILRIAKPNATIFMVFPYKQHHDSQEHYHYFSNNDNEQVETLNGIKTCTNIVKFLSNYNITADVEIFNEIEKDENKKNETGGFLSFFIKIKNKK